VWGHRRNVEGYAQGLLEFDTWLGTFLPKMKYGDVIMITADHGNDPTHAGTDHTREYVPLLIYGPQIPAGTNLGTIEGFCCIGQTIAYMLGVGHLKNGENLFEE
jgi:phosphopentomutase